MSPQVSFILPPEAEAWFDVGAGPIVFDSFRWNEEENRCGFYQGNKLAAGTKRSYYRFSGGDGK